MKRSAGKSETSGRVSKVTSAKKKQDPGDRKAKKQDSDDRRVDARGKTVRYKAKATIKDEERIARALPGSGHRLFLVARNQLAPPGGPQGAKAEFSVLGHSGNVYTVTIGKCQNCDCPDFQKGNLCKHILFVMLRVLKLSRDNHLVWQRALLRSEADEVLSGAWSVAEDPTVMASQRVRETFQRHRDGASAASGAPSKPVEGDCPICFDELGEGGEATVECCTCHNHVHAACMTTWKAQRRAQGHEITCVYCRSPWQDGTGLEGTSDDGKYLNLKNISEEHRNAGTPADYHPAFYNPGFHNRGTYNRRRY